VSSCRNRTPSRAHTALGGTAAPVPLSRPSNSRDAPPTFLSAYTVLGVYGSFALRDARNTITLLAGTQHPFQRQLSGKEPLD
jgi:hypothetical protein